MEIARYMAMTADEYAAADRLPDRIAWMACHFSPYSTSLSNTPANLPECSLLILNDSTPPENQDIENIANSIVNVLNINKCSGLLLDFQRPDNEKSAEIVDALLKQSIPVCVSEIYAQDLDCPIFLPPLPLTETLDDYIRPYKNREIWLDTALSCIRYIISASGSIKLPVSDDLNCQLEDNTLHCHYRIDITDDCAIFTLRRTREDLENLISEAEKIGITTTLGLYQELK